ncbi:ribosomal protein S18-alanine N-acetyltransferase [Sinosporangium album]|nr:ribosomal protein S18-alanine N-acetyltransferase [Sinosporangium album]
MTFADLPPVMGIERATFPADAWTETMMRGELADQPRTRHYVVAERDGEIIAYGGLAAAGDQADVQTIAVLADHRRSGIGRLILSELLAEAARRGTDSVFLEVRADNDSAKAMYTAFGFEPIGTRLGYYDDGADAIVMTRKLDG